MCGRYIIREQEAAERCWRVHGLPKWVQSFNVSPSSTVPVIRKAGPGRAASRTPHMAPLRRMSGAAQWGLVPFWSRGVRPKYPTYNARVENIDSASAFRGPWGADSGASYPLPVSTSGEARPEQAAFLIKLADRKIFGFAGLWDC